jgi:hypothetical protein
MRHALLLLALACTASAQTLRNASFEEPAHEEDRAYGWERWGHWLNRECAWSPVRDGTCIIGYHHWRIEAAETSGLYQDVPVRLGARYAFSVQASLDPAQPGSLDPEAVEVRLETTLEGQQVTVQSRTFKARDLARGEAWSALKVTGVAPNETLRVLLIVHPAAGGPRGGALRFDAARLAAE